MSLISFMTNDKKRETDGKTLGMSKGVWPCIWEVLEEINILVWFDCGSLISFGSAKYIYHSLR